MLADALVVGGGLQGLVVLRALTEAGHRAVLVTDGELGAGQTLHAHGLLDSGTGLVTGETRGELLRHVLPELRRLGVPVRSGAPSYLRLPAPRIEELRPLWAVAAARPRPVRDAEVPGLRLPGPLHEVTAHLVSKPALVAALVGGLGDRVFRGRLVGVDDTGRVELAGRGPELTVGVVVVTAGCGTPRLLTETLGAGTSLVERLGHLRTHMICLRAPAGVLPVVGTVVTPDLAIIAHQGTDGADLWYVTPQAGQPVRVPVVPDDAHADVDPEVVVTGVTRLRELVPVLAGPEPPVEATVFAGYKQDVDGQVTRPLVEMLPGDPPVIVAVPSVYAGAWANAREVVRLVAASAPARGDEGPLHLGTDPVPLGQVDEARPEVRWRPWHEWARC